MKNNYKEAQLVNLAEMTSDDFMEYYNHNIPDSHPRATPEALLEFQMTHPNIFDDSKTWTIDKHRRRFMDWISSYRVKT